MGVFHMELTQAGEELLARSAAGSTLRFCKVLLGDGSSSQQVSSMISTKKSLPVQSVVRTGNQVAVRAVLSLTDLTESFYWRELGVTAFDPDTQSERLFAYGSSEGEGDYISSEGSFTEKQITVKLAVLSASNVEVSVDSSLLFAGRAEFESFQKKAFVTFDCVKTGTVFELTGDCANGFVSAVFTAPGSYQSGDTFTVNGTAYAVKLNNGEEAEDDLFVSGAVVACVLDTENHTINFKSSGGSVKYASGSAVATQTDSPSYGDYVYKFYEVTGLNFKPCNASIDIDSGSETVNLFWDKDGNLIKILFGGRESDLVKAELYDGGFAIYAKQNFNSRFNPGTSYNFYAMGV